MQKLLFSICTNKYVETEAQHQAHDGSVKCVLAVGKLGPGSQGHMQLYVDEGAAYLCNHLN